MTKSTQQADPLVELKSVSNQIEAEKIRLLLQEEGIVTYLQHEKSDQFIQVITGTIDRDLGIYVKASELQKAQQLLEEIPELTLDEEDDLNDTGENRGKRNRRVFLWIVIGLLILVPVLSMMITGVFNALV